MSKFHSTVTRRDFMRGLGLGAAGIGAAIAGISIQGCSNETVNLSTKPALPKVDPIDRVKIAFVGVGNQGSSHLRNFLNIALRSTFENANILILLRMRGLIDEKRLESLLDSLDKLCRQVTNFQKTLK